MKGINGMKKMDVQAIVRKMLSGPGQSVGKTIRLNQSSRRLTSASRAGSRRRR